MPFPGTVWAPNSWHVDAWAANTWADAAEIVPGPDIDFPVTLYVRRDLAGAQAVRLGFASSERVRFNLMSEELV